MNYPMTRELQQAYKTAYDIAAEYSNEYIGTEHILYGILKTEGYISDLLKSQGVDPEIMRGLFKEEKSVNVTPEESPRVKQLPKIAHSLAMQTNSPLITSEHAMFVLLEDVSCMAATVLQETYRISVESVLRVLKRYLLESASNGTFTKAKDASGTKLLPPQLKDLGVDLTQKARENKTDPVVGRQAEIERIIEILCRKTKNNPVLIGEPGVGKSAIVEGLARAIIEERVPRQLRGKIIFAMDLGSLMAGTKYRGALEEKLKNAVDIITEQGDIIVFIDELHTLAQAGSKEGEVTPADILKPYLARGELQTVGATTTDEYRKYIEKDKALERRFQPIIVEPPTVEQTIEILKGLRENYESFHKVKLSDEAIEAAVKLSDRYIQDRFLPDKAIDLIDEAMSRAKVNSSFDTDELVKLKAKLKELETAMDEQAARRQYQKAEEYKRQIEQLNKQINEQTVKSASDSEKKGLAINSEDIAAVVAKWTKIPVTKLTETETQKLMGLEDILHKRVIGQDKAVQSVSKAIRRARAGLKNTVRPVGSFLFLGPTGVGKTELTKALAEAMFDNENNIIRLDMSEYMESHSVSKLIGAPPGYVGFDDGGQLTEQIRRKPYSVVLFDEIEKAHPDVYNALLQILDDGRLTDSQGRVVSFKNAIIIMTSNVGVSELKGKRALGFYTDETAINESNTEKILSDALKRHFKPEFLNRIDVICIFDHLTKDDILKIAHLLLDKVENSLKERNISMSITQAALDFLVDRGYDSEYGARPLRRVIEQNIEDTIAEAMLRGDVRDGSKIVIDCKDGKIIIK